MSAKREETQIEVNLTPLIDCVFLLLIFFMVTTVFATARALRVELPRTVNYDKVKEKDLNLIISDKGELTVNGGLATKDDVEYILREERNKFRAKTLIIQADENSAHGDLIDALTMANRIGFEKIAIATEEEKREIELETK